MHLAHRVLEIAWPRPLVPVVLQVLSFLLVGVIEGSDDPLSPEFTPLKSLAVNLAIGATGLVAILLLGWMTRVPWRTLPTITLLTTPIQAVGEELMYRSVMLPAAASWVRAVRPVLAVGLVVSALGFAAVHGSTPWLAGYFIVVAVSTGLMAIISAGMEALIRCRRSLRTCAASGRIPAALRATSHG